VFGEAPLKQRHLRFTFDSSVECSIRCIKTLLKVLHYHTIYKDVFREVGLLEVMVTCLHRYATLLKEVQNDGRGKCSYHRVNCSYYLRTGLDVLDLTPRCFIAFGF